MDLMLLIAGAVALLLLAGAVGMIALADDSFAVRVGPRASAAPQAAEGAWLSPRLVRATLRLGALAGRGELEGSKRASLTARLVRAGFYGDRAAEAFYGARALGALALAIIAAALVLLLRRDGGLLLLLAAAAAVGVGLFAPNLWLSRRIASRQRALRLALPDAVDLMVVCLEAGGGLGAAIQRVEAEFRDLHPVLAEHFRIMLLEMQAGSSRAEALQRFSDRAGGDEVRALVTLLIQSEALGASMAQTMRVFAQEVRATRYVDAERRAAELPVKMALPLVLCIFPALVTVIFVPIAIRFARILFTH
jgi:tight adherence protein C